MGIPWDSSFNYYSYNWGGGGEGGYLPRLELNRKKIIQLDNEYHFYLNYNAREIGNRTFLGIVMQILRQEILLMVQVLWYFRVYGSVISFYEDYPETKLTDAQKAQLKLTEWKNSSERRILAKKCICFLSRWPFFEAFEKFLFFLYKRVLMGPYEIPLERYIAYFLNDVPFPR